MRQPATRLLIVEDNPGDVFLFSECLREFGVDIELLVASEVDEGIRLLNQNQERLPCLVLIDLHLPKRDGRHLLVYMREQPRFATIPAVVLSSSQRPADHQACLGLGAREVLIKPYDWNGYAALIVSLSRYWTGPSLAAGM